MDTQHVFHHHIQTDFSYTSWNLTFQNLHLISRTHLRHLPAVNTQPSPPHPAAPKQQSHIPLYRVLAMASNALPPTNPAIVAAQEARKAYLEDPRATHLVHLFKLCRNLQTSTAASIDTTEQVMLEGEVRWNQSLKNDTEGRLFDATMVPTRVLCSSIRDDGLLDQVFRSLFLQRDTVLNQLPAGAFQVHLYIEQTEHIRKILTAVSQVAKDTIQILEASKAMFDEEEKLLASYTKLESTLTTWRGVIEAALSSTGHVRVMEVGLRAVAKRQKKEWEDEMLLTKLVPVG